MSQPNSRRTFLSGSLATALAGTHHSCFPPTGFAAGARTASTSWKWELLSAHRGKSDAAVPIARDPWNSMLSYRRGLYLFGGAYPKFGPPRGPGDLTSLGVANDLWRFDLGSKRWQLLEEDNGQALFDSKSARPSGRVLPCWTEVDGTFYLFGGLTVRAVGWKTRLLNDLWSYDPAAGRWSLLEPDDGRMLLDPTQVDAGRPTALAAMGVGVIGKKIYMLAGWGGQQPRVVLSPQLWSYDVQQHTWECLGSGKTQRPWPQKRYCPALTAWNGKLFLWAGRDTQDRSPQFYNDLWMYDPAAAKWEKLAANQPRLTQGSKGYPTARYAMGQARVGSAWYVFGGFGSERGNGPQLNDLWRLDLRRGNWSRLEPHDGSKDYTATAVRPCVRRVPAMTAAGDAVYMFGGLDLTSGPDEQGPLIGFNDVWRGTSVG